MPTLAKYKIDLELSAAKFKRQMRGVSGDIKKIGNQALQVGKLMGAIVPAAGVAGLAAMTKQALEGQAALYDMSQRLGVTTEGLSRLQYAAEQSGVSTQTLNMGLQRMTRRVSEAANGSGEAVKALDELGISAEKLTKIAPEEQFKVLADSIMAVEDPADRVRLAMKLFDSEGVSLIQTMQGGSKATEAMGDEADRFGVTIGGKAAEAAKRATDAFTRLGASFTGVANTIGSQFAPEIEAAANWLSDTIPSAIQFARDALLQARRGFVLMTKGVVDARIAWNEFTGDIAEADALRKTSEILGQMNADLITEQETLKTAAGATREYAVETDGASYSLQQFTNTAVAANQTLNNELQGVIDSLKTQEEKILESFERRRAIITQNTEAESALRLDLMRRLHEQTLPEIELQAQKQADTFYGALEAGSKDIPIGDIADQWSGALGQITSATGQFAGEQSGIYKALFAIEKGAAIARSIVAIQTGIAQAAANPWPANLAAMASVASATAGIVSTITSTQFGGARAMGGNVDAGKSYLVGERGPEMFMPQQSGSITPNNQLAQQPQVNIRMVNVEGSDGYANWAAGSEGEQVFINQLQRNKRLIQSLAV